MGASHGPLESPVVEPTNWKPATTLEMMRARAGVLTSIRGFFYRLGVLEVETPVCSASSTPDPVLQSFSTCYTGPGAPAGQTLYLHTSPEFPMKRLLAAGSGSIYQICKVFRDGEAGRFHNPEFTLLEWYRSGFDHHQLMVEVEQLMLMLMPDTLPVVHLSYHDLFMQHLGIAPHDCTVDQLRQCARAEGIQGVEVLQLPGTDAWLDLLLTHLIEPGLPPGLCFVYDYPASQASLARIRPGKPAVAERFELYLNGMEIANGFHELADAEEQKNRFLHNLQQRRDEGKSSLPMDYHLLNALEAGLPDCAGVAVGIDRLLMAITGADHINEVISFPLERA